MRYVLRPAVLLLLTTATMALIGYCWYSANAERRRTEWAVIAELQRSPDFPRLRNAFDERRLFADHLVLSAFSMRSCVVHHRSIAPRWITHRTRREDEILLMYLQNPVDESDENVLFRIEEIVLDSYSVDVGVVEPLSRLTWLEKLTLHETGVSYDGLRRLQAALPHTEIVYNRRPLGLLQVFPLVAGAGYAAPHAARRPLPRLLIWLGPHIGYRERTLEELFKTNAGMTYDGFIDCLSETAY